MSIVVLFCHECAPESTPDMIPALGNFSAGSLRSSSEAEFAGSDGYRRFTPMHCVYNAALV